MAVLVNNNVRTPVSTNNNNELPRSEYWINIGVNVNGKFISLNKGGIPLDRVEKIKINPNSDNKEWIAQAMLHNNLVDALLQGANQLNWGEHQSLALSCELIKINNPAQVNQTNVEVPSVDSLMTQLFQ